MENRKYVYNESNQLSEVVLCDGKTTRKEQYTYDGDGNRVYQLNYNPDKDEDFSDYYCTKNSRDYKGTGIRLRVEGEVSPAERELLSLINASGAVTDSSHRHRVESPLSGPLWQQHGVLSL